MRLCISIVFTSYGVWGHNRTFPPNFLFGVAQSAYQVEGIYWNMEGKKDSIWDYFIHENRSRIYNRDTVDYACDSYHLYKKDIRLAAAIGVNMYRFSISWARLHFGIYYVDMEDPRRTRYPKKSAVYIKQLTSQSRLPAIESIGPLYADI